MVDIRVDQVDAASKTPNGILYSGKIPTPDGSAKFNGSAKFTGKIANDVAVSSDGKFWTIDGSKLKTNLSDQNGDTEMYEIAPVRTLTTYDDDVNADVYRYNDEQQKFYFLAQFVNETRGIVENGVLVKPADYDVLISRIGKTDGGGGRMLFVSMISKQLDRILNITSNLNAYVLQKTRHCI